MGSELPKVTQHVRGRALHVTSWAPQARPLPSLGLCVPICPHHWTDDLEGLILCYMPRVPAPLRVRLLDGVGMDYPSSVIWPPEQLAVPTTVPQAFFPPPASPSFLSLRASPARCTADSGSHRCFCSWPTCCHPGPSQFCRAPCKPEMGVAWQGP